MCKKIFSNHLWLFKLFCLKVWKIRPEFEQNHEHQRNDISMQVLSILLSVSFLAELKSVTAFGSELSVWTGEPYKILIGKTFNKCSRMVYGYHH